METTVWRPRISLICIALLLSGCAKPYAMWQVIVGNYRYEQGRYHEATSYYFNSLQLEYQQNIIYFNLGSLYHALGEAKAAEEMWLHIDESSPDLLRSQAYYNRGVTYYQLGMYDHAITHFRNALLLNSQDVNAKINLELSLEAHRRSNDNQKEESPPIPESSQRQLDYLKRRNTLFLGVDLQEPQWTNPDDV